MGDAAIAHVVHVQAVARYDVLYLVLAARYPVPHHREPPEHSHLHFVGHRTDGIHDEQVDGPLEHARGELRIHQHDVEPGRLETADSLADRAVIFLDVPTPQRLVAACLPDDELRVVRQHVALEARQHLEGHLAADALVDHGHRELRPAAAQLFGEQGGIGVRRIGGPDSLRRGGADGEYDQRLARTDRAGGVGQPHLEACYLLRRGAAKSRVRDSGGCSREQQERRGGRHRPSRRAHRPLSGLAAGFPAGRPRVTKSAIAWPMQS